MTKERAIGYLGMAVPLTALTVERFAEFDEAIHMAVQALEAEPKTGKWTIKNGELAFWDVCSECGRMVIHKAPFYNYCPHCGSYNGGEQE